MAKSSADILAAVESFVGRLGDGQIRVRKGDLFTTDHPAVKKWPHLFGPVHDIRSAPVEQATAALPVEQATAAPGEKRAR